MKKLTPQALVTAALFIVAAVGQTVGQTVASAGTFPGVNGRIAFASGGDIEVINPDGTGRANLTKTGVGGESEPAWDPTGSKLVFGDGAAFFTINSDGTNRTPLYGHDTFATNPTWSADGSVVAFDGFLSQSERRI